MERSASRPAARPHQGAIANTCDKSRRYQHVAIWRTRQSELPLLVLRTGASGAGGLQNHAISAFHCFPTWPAPAQPVVRCHLLCQEGTVGPEGALRRAIEPHLNPPAPREVQFTAPCPTTHRTRIVPRRAAGPHPAEWSGATSGCPSPSSGCSSPCTASPRPGVPDEGPGSTSTRRRDHPPRGLFLVVFLGAAGAQAEDR
jgi:hypothetical protein